MEPLLLILLVLLAVVVLSSRRPSGGGATRVAGPRRQAVTEADIDAARFAAEEDVTRFGEELRSLDVDVQMADVDEGMRQDWQRALDSYDAANRALGMAQHPDDLRHVTSALEDGRYAVACVRARREGRPLPQRRPPCFFNPAHGPSTVDVDWAPPGGQPRRVPVCAADQDRLQQGAEPDVRTVAQGAGRVPYWAAGPAYSPWAMGYFGGFLGSGLLPGFMLGSLLATDWDGTPTDGFDTGYGEGYDEGYSDGADGSDQGDGGGYDDGGSYDSSGDYGGGDYGGGDFGGGDFGGGDFGGDFGGGDF